jgi:predicted PurR-regulated permease PerM
VAAMQSALWQRAAPIYLALLLASMTVLGVLVLIELQHVLLILFISVLFAAALSGPTKRLERWRIPRALSVPLIYLVTLALVIVVAWLVTPPLFDQVASFADRSEEYARRYDELREAYNRIREDYPSLASFDTQVRRLGQGILERAGDRAVALPATLFGLFLDLLSVFVISTLLLTNRERILSFILTLVHPRHREETRSVLTKMWTRIGYYLRAKVIVMAIVGAITYLALLLIGVPFALPLAIVVALGEAIPRAGPWLARIPLLAIAALEGLATFGLTLAASVAIENLKGYVISPTVEGQQLDIHPLLVFVSVLVGGALLGVPGAFVAVPAAAMLQVLAEEVLIPWRRRQVAAEPPLPPAAL